MKRAYQICTKCIMDTTDPDISFDDDGICFHCHNYEETIQAKSYRLKKEPGALDRLVARIREKGKGKKYDCLIGVSGGIDSTYTAYVTKRLGLRPLAFHLDNGWDSEVAVRNTEKALKKLEIDLYRRVLDQDEFRDLQLAFLKASTPESEIPTDHALLALFYEIAARENISFILSGHNTATEGGGVPAWSQGHGDWRYVKSVHREFGRRKLKDFPHYGPWKFIYYALVKKIHWIQILDFFDYEKSRALDIIQNELGWQPYGAKHHESIYTRFIQSYLLPRKFGFDKKRLHVSSLIWSGQLSREEALAEMKKNDYPRELQEQDKAHVIQKLKITPEEFERIMAAAPKTFWDYPSYKKIFQKYKKIISIYHSLLRG